MASTGLMLIALHAGASPASPPRKLRIRAAPMAVQNPTWKWAVRMPSEVLASSSICRRLTPKSIPLIPATAVRRMLSDNICESIILGVAPMARRIPISVVRSFTVTIMIFETPMAPASKVPIPMSHIRKLTPLNRLSSMVKSSSVLKSVTAFSSVGSTVCALAITVRMRSVMELITTPGLAVTARLCIWSPELYIFLNSEYGIVTSWSGRPLMFIPSTL